MMIRKKEKANIIEGYDTADSGCTFHIDSQQGMASNFKSYQGQKYFSEAIKHVQWRE